MLPPARIGEECPSPTSIFHFSLSFSGQAFGSALRVPSLFGPRHSGQSAAISMTKDDNNNAVQILFTCLIGFPRCYYALKVMPDKSQSLQNHGRTDPAYHQFLVPLALVLLIGAIVNLVRNFGWSSGFHLLAVVWAIVAMFKLRLYAIK